MARIGLLHPMMMMIMMMTTTTTVIYIYIHLDVNAFFRHSTLFKGQC